MGTHSLVHDGDGFAPTHVKTDHLRGIASCFYLLYRVNCCSRAAFTSIVTQRLSLVFRVIRFAAMFVYFEMLLKRDGDAEVIFFRDRYRTENDATW